MEITQDNFEAHFSLIKESIATAEFISIDSEFSGHTASLEDKGHDYDTVEERYQKLRFTCQKFLAFQFGICTFHWVEKDKKYRCRPFSFYVFPKSKINDTTMLFQASSINFLSNNNFDFNKLFASAITYTSLGKKDLLRQECLYKITKTFPSMRSFTSLSTAHQRKLEELMVEIDTWVFDTNSGETLTFHINSYSLKKALAKEVTKRYMKTGVFTEYQRGITETIIKKSKSFKQRNFTRGISSAEEANSQTSLGFQLDEEELKEEIRKSPPPTIADSSNSEAQQQADEVEIEQMYQHELGFSRVIELLMKSTKPLIGHNMIFDVAFIYRQFISEKNDLPKTYAEFATLWRKSFPATIYDTKVLGASCGNLFGKTDLTHLYYKCGKEKKLSNNLIVEFDKTAQHNFAYEGGNCQEHDAGYDAYMTGCVFLRISKYIEIGKIILISGNANSKPSSQTTVATVPTPVLVPKLKQSKPHITKKGKKVPPARVRVVSSSDEEEKLVENAESSSRKIKHYSMVQNKQVYFGDLKEFANRIMLSIEVPRYFYLESGFGGKLSQAEIDYEKRLKESVIFVTMKDEIGAKKIAELFNVYGDINVVKNTDNSVYIEFSYIDNDVVHSKRIQDLIKRAEKDLKKSNPGLIQEIVMYDHAKRFVCNDSGFPYC